MRSSKLHMAIAARLNAQYNICRHNNYDWYLHIRHDNKAVFAIVRMYKNAIYADRRPFGPIPSKQTLVVHYEDPEMFDKLCEFLDEARDA